jgi:hypothetical protein
MTDVEVTVTRYTVSAIPENNINRPHLEIEVVYRGDGMWAVSRHRECLGTDGQWEWEPSPSNREDDWLATHRFDLDTALQLAQEAAPHLTVNGHTVEQVLARAAERRGE